MLVLGLILLVVGAVVAYLGRPRDQLIVAAGVIIFGVGCVFILLALLGGRDVDVEAAGYVPLLGMAAVPPGSPRRRRSDRTAVAQEKSWLPTRKWYALVTGGLASIAASWILSGAFDDVERGMAATLLVGAVSSYWTPNADTAGGVPPK